MDPRSYKTISTSRGLTYNYYFSPALSSKPTLLFCHGFPCTSRDWRFLISHFQPQGYGIVAPDMLGYGGTDKPTDPSLYRHSLICQDVVNILDAEKIEKAVAIGHDWGSYIVSRLSNYFPERFSAYAFFAAPFAPPNPTNNLQELLEDSKRRYGYETRGYWLFLAEEGTDKLIEDNWDSFFSLLYPHDPALWRTDVAPIGAAKANLLAGFKGPLPTYITEEDEEITRKILLGGGLAAPICWYKVMISGIGAEDDKAIPESRKYPPTSCPIFFGAGNQDQISLSDVAIKSFAHTCFENHDITVGEYHADHWLILSVPDEINRELGAWLEGVTSGA